MTNALYGPLPARYSPERGDLVTARQLVGLWEVGLPGTGADEKYVWLIPPNGARDHSILVHADDVVLYCDRSDHELAKAQRTQISYVSDKRVR